MKRLSITVFIALIHLSLLSCGNSAEKIQESEVAAAPVTGGQSDVKDDISQKNIVQAAASSKDLSTLVKAVQQGDLVDALSNAGPFTVFAPVNAAFDQLPAGTLNDLMKDENKEKLRDILQYHVSVGVLKEDLLQEGQIIGEVNGTNIKISKKDKSLMINDAKVLAAIPVSNGIVYTIDKVLLPK